MCSLLERTDLLNEERPNKDLNPLEREVIKHARPEKYRSMEIDEMHFDDDLARLDSILDYWENPDNA